VEARRRTDLCFVLAITAAPTFAQPADSGRLSEDSLLRPELGQSPQSGLLTANIDAGARPQTNLFRYANGAWLGKVAIPADRARWGIDDMMAEESLIRLRGLLEDSPPTFDVSSRKAAALYASLMDTGRVELLGVTPLRTIFNRIDAIASTAGLSRTMAELLPQAVRLPVAVRVQADAKDSRHYAAYFRQGGLGLPDRDYYLVDNEKFVAARTAYRDHIDRMLSLIGDGFQRGSRSHPRTREPACQGAMDLDAGSGRAKVRSVGPHEHAPVSGT
jgi:putative endopeptidase